MLALRLALFPYSLRAYYTMDSMRLFPRSTVRVPIGEEILGRLAVRIGEDGVVEELRGSAEVAGFKCLAALADNHYRSAGELYVLLAFPTGVCSQR